TPRPTDRAHRSSCASSPPPPPTRASRRCWRRCPCWGLARERRASGRRAPPPVVGGFRCRGVQARATKPAKRGANLKMTLNPVTRPRDARSERHPLRDTLLGAFVLLEPMLGRARAATPSSLAPVSTDAELLDVCLGVLALAWRLEGVLLAVRAS